VGSEATDPERDPDRRAWHRAHSVISADEDIASALERSADRARARGGIAATAAFLERATGLTPDPGRRATRALAAAHAMQLTGAHSSASQLLSSVRPGVADELQLAQAELLRAQIAFTSSRGSDAPPLLLKAAKQLEPLDVSVARETYLDAICAAIFAGRLALGAGLREVAAAARDATGPTGTPDFVDLMLDGLSLLVTDGYVAGTPALERALRLIVEDEDAARGDRIRWLWVANNTAMNLWDDDAWDTLSQRQVDLTRQSGALAVLPIALNQRLGLHFLTGELGTAESLGEEAMAISRAVGTPILDYGAVGLAALRGREQVATRLIDDCVEAVVPRGEGIGLSTCLWARAVLANGLGRYPEALVAAKDAATDPDELTPTKNWALLELVEAAARTGNPEVANAALAQLEQTTQPNATNWASGVEARARALVTDGPAAETLYLEAIDRLGQTRIRVELDRARLLYGEWLRRDGRRSAAREQLRLAHDSFEKCGYEAFAERARRELLATGETVRKRTVETRNDLTPQEAQIAGLAAEGQTNQEIAALLFLSPRTVEWHLRKIYTKLGIASRRELRRALHS
jgi:DNA-binding CsgD family transcriptional regulator